MGVVKQSVRDDSESSFISKHRQWSFMHSAEAEDPGVLYERLADERQTVTTKSVNAMNR